MPINFHLPAPSQSYCCHVLPSVHTEGLQKIGIILELHFYELFELPPHFVHSALQFLLQNNQRRNTWNLMHFPMCLTALSEGTNHGLVSSPFAPNAFFSKPDGDEFF